MAKELETDDIELKEYSFTPKETEVNGTKVIDFTGVEHDKIFLCNKKGILDNTRPSWIPELDIKGLREDSFLPVAVHDDSGIYYVQAKKKVGIHEERKVTSYMNEMVRMPDYEITTYKMTLDVLAATVDYYLKWEREHLKSEGNKKTVSLPRSLKHMSVFRYKDMVNLLKFCENYQNENKEIFNVNLRRSSPLYRKQNTIVFAEQYQPFLQNLRDKRLDLNLQKQDYIDAHAKGEDTSYSSSGTLPLLLDDYGVRIKKQNGKPLSDTEIEAIRRTISDVYGYYGNLSNPAKKYNLVFSYADNCNQHARKAIGLFIPYYNAIGVSFFKDDGKKNERALNPSCIFSHEMAHLLDSLKGGENHFFFASDKDGTLENKIAVKYKQALRKAIESHNRKFSREKDKQIELGEYWFRTCECLARSVEQDYALRHGIKIAESGYLPEDIFIKEIQPLVMQLLAENRKHFNLMDFENTKENKLMAKMTRQEIVDYYISHSVEHGTFVSSKNVAYDELRADWNDFIENLKMSDVLTEKQSEDLLKEGFPCKEKELNDFLMKLRPSDSEEQQKILENSRNYVSAKKWCWTHYNDNSGGLSSPDGKDYFSYDWTTLEYKKTPEDGWNSFRGAPDEDSSFGAFKEYAEKYIRDFVDVSEDIEFENRYVDREFSKEIFQEILGKEIPTENFEKIVDSEDRKGFKLSCSVTYDSAGKLVSSDIYKSDDGYNKIDVSAEKLLKDISVKELAAENNVSLDLQKLFEHYKSEGKVFFENDRETVRTEKGKIRHLVSDGVDYYDFCTKAGYFLCCDGETASVQSHENGLYYLKPENNDESERYVSLSDSEYSIAARTVALNIDKEFSNIDFEKECVDEKDSKFRYMLLNRMQTDCDYYLGNGHRNPKFLWALDEQKQIKDMISLYRSFPEHEKPQWLTVEQMNDYAVKITGKSVSAFGVELVSVSGIATNFVLEKLRTAGIEVITDKEEFDRILQREEFLQKMAKGQSPKYLNPEDMKMLKGWGYKTSEDLEQIQTAMLLSDIKLNGKKTGVKKAVEILGREKFLGGISRSAFHSTSANEASGNYVEFDSSVLFSDKSEDLEKLRAAEKESKEHISVLNEIARKDSYFQFNEDDTRRFIRKVDEWQKDNTNPRKLIVVGNIPPVMKVLGISENLIEIEHSTLDKIVRENPLYPDDKQGHELSLDDIYAIPSQIADPVMVFKSRTRDDSYVFFTERKDKENRSILIPLAVNRRVGRIVINEITSMYGRNNEIDFVKSNLDEDNLIYLDKARSLEWAGNHLKKEKSFNGELESKLQLLGQRITDIETYNLNILTKERLVNFISAGQSQTLQKMSVSDGETYGFAYNGKIYLNPDVMNSNVAVHEYTHLWDGYTRNSNPELWQKGKDIFKDTHFWEEVKNDPNYSDIADDDDLVLSEIHARICGDLAQKVLEHIAETDGEITKNKAVDWNAETAAYILELYKKAQPENELIQDMDASEVKKDMVEFLSMPMKDLMAGKNISIEKSNYAELKLPTELSEHFEEDLCKYANEYLKLFDDNEPYIHLNALGVRYANMVNDVSDEEFKERYKRASKVIDEMKDELERQKTVEASEYSSAEKESVKMTHDEQLIFEDLNGLGKNENLTLPKFSRVKIYNPTEYGFPKDDKIHVLAQYESGEKEDSVFNQLNSKDCSLEFKGKVIDWNPISIRISGTVEQYLEKLEQSKAEEKLRNLTAMPLEFDSSSVEEKRELPFDIINNEEKGRVNIRFNPAKQNPYFSDILKELKANKWKYAPSTRQWYPTNVEGSKEFAQRLQEKYSSVLNEVSVEKEASEFKEDVNKDDISELDDIRYFDRNYNEAADLTEYLNKNISQLKSGAKEIKLSEAKTILNALNHEDSGFISQRRDRLGLDRNGSLVIVSRENGNVEIKKTDLNGLIRTAKEMSEKTLRESKICLEKYNKKQPLYEQEIKDIFVNLWESCVERSASVASDMAKVYENYYREPELKRSKSIVRPLEEGDKVGKSTVADLLRISSGVYQAAFAEGTGDGVFAVQSYFVVDENIASNLRPELIDLMEKHDGRYVIETKRNEPYILKELISKGLMPPRDNDFVQKLDGYIALHPEKYAKLYPITSFNFAKKLKELSEIDGENKKDAFLLGKQLMSMVEEDDKRRVGAWIIGQGGTSEEAMRKLFQGWISGKEMKKSYPEKQPKKDGGYPPRGEV